MSSCCQPVVKLAPSSRRLCCSVLVRLCSPRVGGLPAPYMTAQIAPSSFLFTVQKEQQQAYFPKCLNYSFNICWCQQLMLSRSFLHLPRLRSGQQQQRLVLNTFENSLARLNKANKSINSAAQAQDCSLWSVKSKKENLVSKSSSVHLILTSNAVLAFAKVKG